MNQINSLNDWNRRKFIFTSAKAVGAAAFLHQSVIASASEKVIHQAAMTVGEIMDSFINEVPGAPFSATVDTLKAGNREIKVSGIVTTMFATMEVIKKTIDRGSNFIIAHEPTFYNHADETNWLENDKVYRTKMDLLKKHQVAVWRNHDYIHRHIPDGVLSSVVSRLGWTDHFTVSNHMARLPAMTLNTLIQHTKKRMGIDIVRYIGNLDETCSKILLMPGAAGGRRQIESISKEQPDTLICGEIQEWETAEYVRDARAGGQKISLIVLGHIASEEPGSEYMADWLRKKFPAIPVDHMPAGNSLSFA